MDDKNLTEIGEKIVKQKRPKRSEQMQPVPHIHR